MFIGDKIKKLRKERHLSLVQLSELSGVQIATLSRIENMKMVGTLESHMSIAKALGLDVTDLYRELEPVITQETSQQEPVEVFTQNNASIVELLTKDALRKKMMPIIMHIKPKASTAKEQYRPGTERFAYALKGNINIVVKSTTYTLKSGTSIYFDASLPHFFDNPLSETVSILCVTTPAAL